MTADDDTLLAETAAALPEGWWIAIGRDNGAGCVELTAPDGGGTTWPLCRVSLADALFAAVRIAMGRGEA